MKSAHLCHLHNDTFEVVLELFRKKCLPVLLYGTEACPMKKSHIASLQFVVNSVVLLKFSTLDLKLL